jgi:hypothetical protein
VTLKTPASIVALCGLCGVSAAIFPPALGQEPIVAGRLPEASTQGIRPRPTPRLADGHPDLGNAKGSWNPRVIANIAGTGADPSRSPVEKIVDVPFRPWARAVYDQRIANLSKDDPESRCLPPGVPRLMATPFPFQIFQLPDRILFVFEGGTHIWRAVFTDGHSHDRQPNPSFLGNSTGHWEGDTLVVDATGFNDETWLDQDGHPHTEALHVIERYTRTDEMTLHYEVTIDDPVAYTKPWTNSYTIPWSPSTELYEYVCQENNMDLTHLVGK